MPAAVEDLRERLGTPPGAFPAEPLPVLPPLDDLFPRGALSRGSVVTVEGSTWLALALAAGASQAGSWCAVVGVKDLGAAAAEEAGIDLDRLVLVPSPDRQWTTAVASLLDGFDLVLAKPNVHVKAADARRLAARARERKAVIVAIGSWPDAVDTRLRVVDTEWAGLHAGYGRIAARLAKIAAQGRGAAARERRVAATLPDLGPVPRRPSPLVASA